MKRQKFATKSPGGLEEFRKVNKFFQENIVPFKKGQLSKLVKTEEPESIMAFLKQFKGEGGRGSRALKVFNAMNTEGRKAVRFALVDDAFRAATKDPNTFSAAKFASKLRDAENTTGIFFKGSQKKQLDGLVKLMVKDNGIGIPEEIRDKLFDPFFTTKDVGEGTGLGLSIVRNIIDNHSGKVDVNSEINIGTEIVIELPIKYNK